MRHRATPTFTVEVKRSSKKTGSIFKAADDQPSESRRVAEKLFAGGLSPASVNGSSGGLPNDQHAAAQALLPDINQGVPAPQRRILPDLLRTNPVPPQPEEEVEERAVRRHRSTGPRKRIAEPVVSRIEPRSGWVATDIGQLPPVEVSEQEQPVHPQDAAPALAAAQEAAAPIVPYPGDTDQAGGTRHGSDTPAVRATNRETARSREASALPPGQRWKRRLPRVCW